MGEEKLLALSQFLAERGLTQEEVASALGVSQPYVNALLKGKKGFGKEQAKKWSDLFGLSASWLLTGEGDMLRNISPVKPKERESNVRAVSPREQDWVEIPVVPYKARAGALVGFGDPEWQDGKQTMPVLLDKRVSSDYLIYEVEGDSMDDGSNNAFLEGDFLLCRILPQSDWQYGIKKRRDTFCVIATESEGIILKQVTRHDKAEGTITCHSLNPEYKDYDVSLSDVKAIFYVEELAKRKL